MAWSFVTLYAAVFTIQGLQQLCRSSHDPLMTIDHQSGTLTMQHGRTFRVPDIHAVEFATFVLEGYGSLTPGCQRLALDLGPSASPRYFELHISAINLEQVGAQVAQSLGVPFRRQDRGRIPVGRPRYDPTKP